MVEQMIDIYISLVAALSTIAGAFSYFSKVKNRQTPKMPLLFIMSLIVGSVFGVAALYVTAQSPSWSTIVVILLATMPVMMSAVFYKTFKESKSPLGDIQVQVGDKVLPFAATRANGSEFTHEELKGQRILLKFFRGSWCPYCSMELKMFEEMKPIFDRFNVKIVALSNDEVAAAQKHQQRDHLTHEILSDPDLKVIKKYGVEHHKALGGDGVSSMTLFGLPFPTKMKYKPMAIPTSILIDEYGVIQWIDQAEDVRLRASEEKLLAALNASFAN